MILFGGSAGKSNTRVFYNDVWSFDVESGTWTKVLLTSSPGEVCNRAPSLHCVLPFCIPV